VIDSPLSVSRVIPPTATIQTTITATINSHTAKAAGRAELIEGGWGACMIRFV
jgi:hypothetical protein